MEHIKLFLLIFVSFRGLEAGVQFRHFPITNGRSESQGTSKFETRIPAKPTGRPARPNDLNPLNLITEDNMFPKEKPQSSGSLEDEIRKQLSAHLKASTSLQSLRKNKPSTVIKESVVKSFRKPVKRNNISTRQRLRGMEQIVTTEEPPVMSSTVSEEPFKQMELHKGNIQPIVKSFRKPVTIKNISTRQRFIGVEQIVTTEESPVSSFVVSDKPFMQVELHNGNMQSTARVKIPVKKKRLVFRGRGRKILIRENIIKRIPVDISSLEKQNLLNAIKKKEPRIDFHERKEPDLFSRKIPISPIRRDPALGRKYAGSSEKRQQAKIAKPEIKRVTTTIPSSQNRRQPDLAKIAALFAEKRQQESKINSTIKPRRRDGFKRGKTTIKEIDGGNIVSNRALSERQIINLERSRLQNRTKKEPIDALRSTVKRLHISRREHSTIRQNTFLPKLQPFFQQPKKQEKHIRFQEANIAQVEQVKESNFQKVEHVNSQQVKDDRTQVVNSFDSVHVKDASFQSIHPFNVKATIKNTEQKQVIIPKTVDIQQHRDLTHKTINVSRHTSRVLPVIPLHSSVRITPKGIDIKSQLKQINVQPEISFSQPSRVQSALNKPIIIPSQAAVLTKRMKSVINEAPRSIPQTVTISSQPTFLPNSVTWLPPTISNTEQDTIINEIEYTTPIPKRNLEFEETSKRQHPQGIKLDTNKILKIVENQDISSNEILVYPTFDLAMQHAKATWDQDPFRKKSKNVGKPTFDIDYSLDPEYYETPFNTHNPTIDITTPITTQRPVNTTPFIQREPSSIKDSRNRSTFINQKPLQSLPSERSQQTVELQFRRQQEQPSRREQQLSQQHEQQLTQKSRQQLSQQANKQVLQEQDQQFPQQKLSQFSHQQPQEANQEFSQQARQQNPQHSRQQFTNLIRQQHQQQVRQQLQEQLQNVQQSTQQDRQLPQELIQVPQHTKKARQQLLQQETLQLSQPQVQDQLQQLDQQQQELKQPVVQDNKGNSEVNNFVSRKSSRFRNKARRPKSERRLQNIPIFDQYHLFEEESENQSDQEFKALARALTFTIDWGR